MPIPDYQTLMLPVLRFANDKECKVAEILEPIADQFSLSDEERERLLPSGKQGILHNRIHWAKFYLLKAGLVAAPSRGRFVITGEGRKLLAEIPVRIDVPLLLQRCPAFRDFHRGEREARVEHNEDVEDKSQRPAATPEEQIEGAFQTLQKVLRADLLERIAQNSPSFFERVIVELLVAMGYGGSRKNAATQLGRSGDGGVDGIINEDRLGLDRVYVQAKRYAPGNGVGRPDVQAFVGSLVGLGASKGVFVTTSTFSPQAREFVQHLTQRVILIDGQSLADLMIEHGVGVRTSRTIEFKRLDEDFFSGED